MFETMYHARGIGLAAPQVGRTERLAVIDVDDEPLVVINPEIVESSQREGEGGRRLSLDPRHLRRRRAAEDGRRSRDGPRRQRRSSVEATELLARCLQHEIDHLHGKLFIDYLSVLKRTAALAKWKLEQDKYPGFIRRVALETPEDREQHEHPDEEL